MWKFDSCLYVIVFENLRIGKTRSGTEFDTYAKVVVNAGGPFCDSVENLADKDAKLVICPSSGVHIVLPDYYSPEGMGSIIPKTKDGRILFIDSEARLGKRTVQDLNALSQPYFCSSRACLKWSRYRKNPATEWRVSNTC